MEKTIKNRANTDFEKEEVIENLLNMWKSNKSLRFGQLLINVINSKNDLYNIEDFDLVSKIAEFYGSLGEPSDK